MSIPEWPEDIARTPPRKRESASRFKMSLGKAVKDLRTQMRRMDPDDWSFHCADTHLRTDGLPRSTANPDDPGCVVKWTDGGSSHAVACDGYDHLRGNLRDLTLWVEETRKREDRRTKTFGSNFAAAELPPGDEKQNGRRGGATIQVSQQEAEDLLGVTASAPKAAVEASFREQVKKHHGDSGQSNPEMVQKLKKARDTLVDG